MQPARLAVAVESEPSLPRYRRYGMRDGSVVINSGFLNPKVVMPAGGPDPRLGVIYVESESGAPVVTWVNYAMHPDTVGGTWISEDHPHFLGRMLAHVRGPT